MSANNSEPLGITWLERLWERESDNGGLVAANFMEQPLLPNTWRSEASGDRSYRVAK